MPRPPRADEAGSIYHALNRGNGRSDIFLKEEDYEAFERVIVTGLDKFPVELFSYQWMKNHWHMVLSPKQDGGMSAFLGWITMTHTQRYHAHYQTTGYGHVYQGRFKSFPVEGDDHFHLVCRYTERNALTANLVKRAEDWKWGSLWNWNGGSSKIELSPWPIPRRPGWIKRVNQVLTDKEEKALKKCIQRGCPFGSENWVKKAAKRFNLESTLKPKGRPRKLT